MKKGDLVLLSKDGVQTAISSKYTHPFLGPFEVDEVMENDNYRLILPPTMKIYPVFHVSKLVYYRRPTDELQLQLQGYASVEVVEDEEYEVDAILDEKVTRGKKYYLVKWTGYPLSDASWEPAKEVQKAAKAAIKEYLNKK